MNPIAFITGATAGIGAACAVKFASAQYDLVITGRRADRLEELKERLENTYGIACECLVYDVRDERACAAAWASLSGRWQEVDVLLNNAGLALGRESIHEGSLGDWETMLDTNVKGLLYMTRLVTPGMVARWRGHVINLGSIAGREVYAGGAVYCASKFAVEGLSRAMRIDLAPYGIKVTTVSPGMVETEFSVVRFKGDEGKAGKVYEGVEPLVAEDIAEAVYFAASQKGHVCINDINLTCVAQPSAGVVIRQG